MKLDANQQKAVEHFEGPALVIAGPGSGKTTVIKERIMNLIQKYDVDPKQILAIAFTNTAANEMKDRISNELILDHGEPKICTLHVFGKDLITNHYKQAGFSKEPHVWDEKKIRQIIRQERKLFDRETQNADVAIYKIEGATTGRCYIGQTTNPIRRRQEHFTHSSNRGLYDALQKDDEQFDFNVIEWVKGSMAYAREKYWINHYKNRSAVNLVQRMEQVARKSSDIFVVIYKIKSLSTGTVYIGYTTNPESIRRIIENDNAKRFAFEVIRTGVPWAKAATHVAEEIRKHKSWAVFNREDPEKSRYSNQLRIEIFCQYFNVPYDKILENPEQFENLMEKFDCLKDDIEKAKQQVSIGLFKPDKIDDHFLRAFAKRYEEKKEEANAIDFLDMLIRSANMLEREENQDILRKYRDTYRYVLVDEFQDISPIDFRLVDLFSGNLFAVGDDDQAIYGFRGGDSRIMQKKFGNRKDVKKYEITCNYRSTSTIVRHAKVLIENNSDRIPKNLRANNSAWNLVKVLQTSQVTVKHALLRELSDLLTTDLKKVGILARNWRGETNKIQEILDCSELETQGFEIDWQELDDSWVESSDLNGKYRRKMFLRQGTKEIEVVNIHTAKGREWDKVILLVNTMYDSLPDKRNDLTDERRLFYVAVTRAKQELVVLDGGNCKFISEFQNVPPTKEELKKAFEMELAALEPKFKVELEEALVALQSRCKKELEEAAKAAHKQYENEYELDCLRKDVAKTKSASEEAVERLASELPTAVKVVNENLFKELMPVLDVFESQINDVTETIEEDNLPTGVAELHQSLQHIQQQLLHSLDNHGLKPIETCGEIFNPDYHEEIQPPIHSDDVPADMVIREERRGYLLHNRVIRKAHVVLSKGKNIRIPKPMSAESLKEAYDNSIKAFTDGEIVKGVVVDVSRDEVMIDIGFKLRGYIPTSEFDTGENDLPTVQVGDEIEVTVLKVSTDSKRISLSMNSKSQKCPEEQPWEHIIDILKSNWYSVTASFLGLALAICFIAFLTQMRAKDSSLFQNTVLTKQLAQMESKIYQKELEIRDLTFSIQSLKSTNQRLNRDNGELQKELKNRIPMLDTISEDIVSLRRQLNEQKGNNQELQVQLGKKDAEIQQLQNEKAIVLNENQDLQKRLVGRDQGTIDQAATIRRLRKEKAETVIEYQRSKIRLAEKTSEAESLTARVRQLQNEKTEIQRQNQKLQDENEVLTRQNQNKNTSLRDKRTNQNDGNKIVAPESPKKIRDYRSVVTRAGSHNNQGFLDFERGDYQEAVKQFEQAIRTDSKLSVAHYNLGCAYLKTKRYKDAVDAFNQSVILNQEFKEAYYNLGIAWFRMNAFQAARRSGEKALSIDPNYRLAQGLLTAIENTQQ